MTLSALSQRILLFIGLSLAVLFFSRLGLSLTHLNRIEGINDLSYMILQGLRVDWVLMGYLYLLPFMLSLVLRGGKISYLLSVLIKIWLVLAFTAIVFMEVITPEFIAEYDVRPNRLFIEYLSYPDEVSNMLLTGYKGAITLAVITLFLSIYFGLFLLRNATQYASPLNLKAGVGLVVLSILIGFVGIRSSLQHRPFNPSMVYFSNDNLVNSLILNSSYSVLFAAYNLHNEKKVSDLYGKMPEDAIVQAVRNAMNVTNNDFVSDTQPTLAKHHATYEGKPKNIVILLQESLGSRYVGPQQDRPESLTPNLDKLSDEAWTFENLYATGTRSVRGIEAVVTGFNPTPAQAVVKLSKSQQGFYSIAETLRDAGYQTQFIYGGESHFDNMKSFFLGNGFELIHDLPQFTQPEFVGSWGASDEDLYREAHQQFIKLHQSGKPFFSLVFTSSNHTPFEFPDGCVTPEGAVRASVENAIRYSDCALGKFIEAAKQADYWHNTVFLVVADHDSRAFGSDVVPIAHFDIPALIFGEGIAAKKDKRLVSQIDLPQTLLSLAGVSSINPMTGFDLTQALPSEKQRAMMQFQDNFAWMTPELLTVFLPGEQVKVFRHDGQHIGEEINIDDSLQHTLIDSAKAQALWGNLAYQKGLYKEVGLSKSTQLLSKYSTAKTEHIN